MNISEQYSKQQLDRSAYISEDKYKKSFDLNRIRLAVYKVTGSSSRFSYYYTEYLFFYLLERLYSLNITTTFNRNLFEQIDSLEIISKDDDEEQLKTAEEEWGTETIDRIIDEVTGDSDLGDYNDPTEEEIKQAAEEAASDDSDSGEPFRFPWEINAPGVPNPPDVVTETTKETLEEITNDPDSTKNTGTAMEQNTADPQETVVTIGTKEEGKSYVIRATDPNGRSTGTGEYVILVHDNEKGDVVTIYSGPDVITDVPVTTPDVNGGDSTTTYKNDEGWEVTITCVTTYGEHTDCSADSSNTPTCNEPPCDTPVCDDEPPCDICTSDCCVGNIPCADTPPCDTCGAGDYTPPPCDTCSGDSHGCPADCCVADCCIGNGQCSSDSTCTNNCDCCVSDSTCTNVSCGGDMDCGSNCDCPSDCGSNCDGSSCDCGNDCDNYGDCIDACGGNNCDN